MQHETYIHTKHMQNTATKECKIHYYKVSTHRNFVMHNNITTHLKVSECTSKN